MFYVLKQIKKIYSKWKPSDFYPTVPISLNSINSVFPLQQGIRILKGTLPSPVFLVPCYRLLLISLLLLNSLT